MSNEQAFSGKNMASLLLADYWQKLNIPQVPIGGQLNQSLLQRAWTFDQYIKPSLDNYIDWFENSNEMDNFTYQLSELNEQQLAGVVDVVTGCGIELAQAFFAELKSDATLVEHVNRMTQQSALRSRADLNQGYGRRLGWYAFIRATKPRVVVETGVDKGLGSCVIASAILRNRAEGFEGVYYGTDINPQAGYLFAGLYASAGKILYDDSIVSLSKLNEKIDLFINDSDHSQSYEAEEYKIIHGKLNYRAIVLGDNAHCSSALFDYAVENKKKFIFFSEKPQNHFYPGAGIGICY